MRNSTLFLLCGLLGLSPLVRADVVISEFLASNVSGITDEDGENSDWIELTNISGSPVNLNGWFLTDDASSSDPWVVPDVTLNPGEELVVFASGKDRRDPAGELHTDFKLSSSGEYLGLIRADGVTIESSYSPEYPQQYPDVSYGEGTPGGSTVSLVGADAPLKYLVPADASVDLGGANPYNEIAFDDGAWTSAEMGVGYATVTTQDPYDLYIGAGGDLQGPMYLENTTVYLRIPFQIDDPAAVSALLFSARYDDGFGISINGSPILASANPPIDDFWDYDASARTSHNDSLAIALESFSIDLAQVNLVAGTNILAVHGLNQTVNSSDLLFDCELSAQIAPAGGSALVYMTPPTPGAPNGGGVEDLGPVIQDVTENPARPDLASQSVLKVTAAVSASENPVDRVDLFYRQQFDAESSLQMLDDGVAPDEVAGDGVFSVNIPLAGLQDGEMIRWRVESQDTEGVTSKNPFFQDPLNSPEYYGTAAVDPAISSNLPVLEWFIQNPSGANNRTGTRAAVLLLGEFYDNVFCRVRGASSAGLSKKSYKIDFNTGHHCRVSEDPDSVRVEEINLNTTWTDKAYVRQPLTYDVYDFSGSPGSECFLMRIQQNGVFFSVAAYTEQVDKRLLRREKRMDDDGALYKMYNGGTSGTSGVEKKNRTYEGNADLVAFVAGLNQSGTALENFIFDNVDIPRQLNYLAATVLSQNNDNMRKNYYLYRDSEGSGEWTQMPWDTDLTFGSHYMTGDSIAHDGIWATADYVLGGRNADFPISPSHPFVGTFELPGNRSWSKIIDKLLENDRFKDMFRRRLQTLVDEALMSSEIDDRIDAMVLDLGNDAVLDKAKWGQFGQQQTLAEAIGILENDYLAPRRTHLSVTHLAANAASYPTPQTSSALLPGPPVFVPSIAFGDVEGAPASGNQNEEFIELENPGSEAVDMSGWTLQGGVDFEFLPGTIIEAGGSLYVSPEVAVFRSRASSPTGGEGLNVEGGYDGQISARGELLTLHDAGGAMIASVTTPDNPSLVQQYLRITEMHFSPAEGKDYEFIEVKNIGPSPLDLTGVQFTDGVEAVLSGTLAPGEYGLVVANPANFPGLNIVGTYTGALNNGGEQVTLRDAVGENVLSFEYDGDWFTASRSGGYSLDVIDENAGWSSWDEQFSWAVSREVGGSPGQSNPLPHSNDYASWSRGFFSEAELADPNVSGPDADASGDGIINLMKYALGQDPMVAGPTNFTEVFVDGEAVTLSYSALMRTPDISAVVQVSTDLVNWSTEAALVDSTENGDGTELRVYQSPFDVSSFTRQYLRIRVLKNP